MATPRYFVRTTVPTYDDRDAIVGSRTYRDEMTYFTMAGATARARMLGNGEDAWTEIWDAVTRAPVRDAEPARRVGLEDDDCIPF